jgi:eukaryotic-like serine/threonine-protein kinase
VVDRLRDVVTWPAFADGRYTGLTSIGAGGMGRVFAARDESLDRDVAIKVSHASSADADLDKRLRHEAEVLARLEHPGIVPVHDVGHLADGRIFYVMKLVQGRTLVDHAPLLTTESARLTVFERVAESVAFAHAQGVVHRDLKPGNVMVGRFGEVLVMDWGVARLMAEVHAALPVARVGTPGFMSPEQASGGADAAGPASDVYALGALLRWLFPESTRLPRRLQAIITKCLSPSPSARYHDASGLVLDIARYRAGLAVDAMPETVFDRIGRFVVAHQAIILLIAAYLLMRAAVGYVQGR